MPKKTVTLSHRVELLERQLDELRSALVKSQAVPAEPARAAATAVSPVNSPSAPVSAAKEAATPALKVEKNKTTEERISPQVLAVIAAAVAHFMGKQVRIRSARVIPGNPWAQQGRVFIQASHNLSLTR